MTNDALLELIERYLEGSLPEKERLAAEQRLTSDPGFRAEVELQRAMQEHLGDPGAVRLRKALATVVQSPQAKPASRWKIYRGFRFAALAAALVILIVAAWWALQPNPVAGPEQPLAEQPAPSTPARPDSAPSAPKPEQQAPEQPPANSRLLAQADPADFVPNPTLEARIGGVRGTGDMDVQVDSPAPGAVFALRNGISFLAFRGTVRADSSAFKQPMHLFVYSNRPEAWTTKKPVLARALLPEQLEEGMYRIQVDQTLRLHPGLFYLVLGQQRTLDESEGYRTVWVGRFFLNTPVEN